MPGEPPEGRVRLLILYGGRSAEHEVSCISALHVVRAANPDRYDLRVVGIPPDGGWVDTPAALASGLPPSALASPDTLVRPEDDAGASLQAVQAVTEDGR